MRTLILVASLLALASCGTLEGMVNDLENATSAVF